MEKFDNVRRLERHRVLFSWRPVQWTPLRTTTDRWVTRGQQTIEQHGQESSGIGTDITWKRAEWSHIWLSMFNAREHIIFCHEVIKSRLKLTYRRRLRVLFSRMSPGLAALLCTLDVPFSLTRYMRLPVSLPLDSQRPSTSVFVQQKSIKFDCLAAAKLHPNSVYVPQQSARLMTTTLWTSNGCPRSTAHHDEVPANSVWVQEWWK